MDVIGRETAGATSQAIGKGGQDSKVLRDVAVSRNIASHETGIGAWTDAEIKAAITQGVRKDGTQAQAADGLGLYAKMTETDLNAVVAYLRTVPPKE